ncbi:MAG: LysR family transcriptional regulator [Burkholderiales bacterium]|nr:LysR family transcriptional regulator [Burkholderiales bacterium]
MVESSFRLRIGSDRELALGPGKVALLEAIRDTGSISAAARKLGMSYRRAWLLVDAMNRAFRQPVITTATGGREGGGTELTPTGEEVVRRYRKIEALAAAAAAREIGALAKLMRA